MIAPVGRWAGRTSSRRQEMRVSAGLRFAVIALLAMFAASVASPSHAQGTIQITIVKGGFFVGASAGSGTLRFQGKSYPLNIGGLSAGLTFGASKTDLVGSVRNIRRPSDIEGIYTAIGAGVAVGGGARVLQLRNNKGVVLALRGRQVGLEVDLDLSGLQISLK
jgi:hypothetical protein